MSGKRELLCVGDGLVDFLSCTPKKQLQTSELFRRCPGGSAVNTAIVASRLGLATTLLSAFGADLFGDILSSVLQEEQVDTSSILRVKGMGTALAFASSPRGKPEFCCLRSSQKPESKLTKEHIPKLPHFVHLCSLLSCMLASTEFIDELLQRVTIEQSLLTYDPNIANANVEASLVRSRIMKCINRAHIVKMSADDLALLFPSKTFDEALAELSQMNVPMLIITLGKEGLFVRVGDIHFSLGAISVPVKDTVGAGDAFTAGLVYALSQAKLLKIEDILQAKEKELRRICLFAAAVGAAACTTVGAFGGVQNLAQIKELLKECR